MQGNDAARAQAVRVGQRHHQLFLQHRLHQNSRLGGHQAVEADGDAPLAQRLQLLGLVQVVQGNAHLGTGAVKAGQQARHHVQHPRAKQPHIELAGQPLASALRALARPRRQRQDVGHFVQQRLPGRGQFHPFGGAQKQHRAQFFFQRPDLARQRRLRHVQPGRSAPEVQFFGQCQKVFHLPQVHAASRVDVGGVQFNTLKVLKTQNLVLDSIKHSPYLYPIDSACKAGK